MFLISKQKRNHLFFNMYVISSSSDRIHIGVANPTQIWNIITYSSNPIIIFCNLISKTTGKDKSH